MTDLSFEGDVAAARLFIIDTQYASIAQVQRRLRVGAARAFRILTALEEQGVIGARTANKDRVVLIPRTSTRSSKEEQ